MINTRELVGRRLTKTNQLLVLEAYRRGIQFEILPKKRFRVSYKNRSFIIRRGRFSLAYNTRLAIRTVNLKEVTSRMLRSKGHPAPENTVFSSEDLDRAWNWAKPILPIVLKPFNGRLGRLVFVNITDYEEFKVCFEKITKKHDEVLVEKFVKGDEYRFFYVNNEIVSIAKRVPANIIGDGKNSVKKLIKLKNKERENRKNPIHKKLKLDRESERVLVKHGYSFDYIPKKGQKIYLRDNSNISTGGDAVDVTKEIDNDIKNAVRKAIRSIPGLRVCGADILINDKDFFILEINADPMLSMHHYPWVGETNDVASKVIDGMFPETIKQKTENHQSIRKRNNIKQRILNLLNL